MLTIDYDKVGESVRSQATSHTSRGILGSCGPVDWATGRDGTAAVGCQKYDTSHLAFSIPTVK